MTDELELSAVDLDRLLHLVEKKLPHLLDERPRIDWYIAEVLSYWHSIQLAHSSGSGKQRSSRGRKTNRDWPMTILNRMLRVEMDRFGGTLPNPVEVRAEQAERRLAQAAARNAEVPLHDRFLSRLENERREAARAVTDKVIRETLEPRRVAIRCPNCTSSTNVRDLRDGYGCHSCGHFWHKLASTPRARPREIG